MMMQELADHRSQLKGIGVNINQIAQFLNSYPEENGKELFAKTTFHRSGTRAIDSKYPIDYYKTFKN